MPHDLIKAKVLSSVKNIPVYSSQSGIFSNKKYGSRKWWTCAELCEAFTFFMESIRVQFDGIVYQRIVRIPMGIVTYSGFIFILLLEGFYV